MKKIYLAFFVFSHIVSNAQENIGTEEVTVTSTYRPVIKESVKLNDNPILDDKDVSERKKVDYSIISFPVESTFKPEKGEVAKVDSETKETYYNNYIYAGAGNYSTYFAELGIVEKVDKNFYIGGFLKHRSSNGGIDDLLVDNKFGKSSLSFLLGDVRKSFNWNLDINAGLSNYNWYGIANDYLFLNPTDITNVDFQQKYQNVGAKGVLSFNKEILKTIDINYNYFWDAYDSKESNFVLSPKFIMDLKDQKLHIDLNFDYVNSQFAKDNFNALSYKNSSFVMQAEPSLNFTKDDYNISLGAGIAYAVLNNGQEDENKLHVYPKIKANVDLVRDIVIGYAGIDGGVHQNTYQKFAEENPFISPEMKITPTFKSYDIYGGLKGKIYHDFSYNVKASYKAEDNKAFYSLNDVNINQLNREAYQYGNSLKVVYDAVKTLSGFGELTFEREVAKVSAYANYNFYTLENSEVAYNLPELTLGINSKFNLSEKFAIGADFYFTSARKDLIQVNTPTQSLPLEEVKMNSFGDLNLFASYQPTKQWSIHVKGNNILNQKYYSFTNYQVQGFQVSAGVMYKFNFNK